MARVISRVHETWAGEKLADMLLINVKRTFDHVSRNCLLRVMEDMDTNGDLMKWTESFMSDRNIGLAIDGHHCMEGGVETGVLQESPFCLQSTGKESSGR